MAVAVTEARLYIPEQFVLTDRARIVDAIRQHGFAILITAADGAPLATHLPFLLDEMRGPHGTLLGHMARANPQWRDFARLAAAGREALVIFQGPHAYVSPSWYGGGGPSVPTWNYLAVHAYGTPRMIEDTQSVRTLLERLVETHEANLDPPWRMDRLDAAYLRTMQRGIVAFEIPLTRVQAKAKLNQNKAVDERRGVVRRLEATGRPGDREVAALMRAAALPD
jgi:transcriptional regulator